MTFMSNEGVIQVATGNRHQQEAFLSVERIRPYLNGRPITLVTDKPHLVPPGLYDKVVVHRQPQKPTEIRFYRLYVFLMTEHYF